MPFSSIKSDIEEVEHQVQVLNHEYSVSIHSSIKDIEAEWNKLIPRDILFSFPFLNVIESYPPERIRPYYGICHKGSQCVGILYFHTSFIKLNQNLRYLVGDKSVSTFLKRNVTRLICFHCTVLGNTMLTGKYGLHFLDSIQPIEIESFVRLGLDQINKSLRREGKRPGLTVIKDFYLTDKPFTSHKNLGLTPFMVQPKMHLAIHPDWKTYQGYLETLKSKYRVRNNKARSFMTQIETKTLDVDEIREHKHRIHQLYKNISDNAGFNAFLLHVDYFWALKEALGTKLTFVSYWLNGQMIAFFTSIDNHEVLDAHFLGYSSEFNASHHLYHNILLDLLTQAIDLKKTLLDLSRTATEIKSTIGALPQDMELYIRHENRYINKISKPILSFVKPEDDFILRNPFR